jgi:hypothetical protein
LATHPISAFKPSPKHCAVGGKPGIAEIATLQTQLASDELELNDWVAAYYGLDVADKEVIADFLARF